MMDAGYFVGRKEIIDWINETLQLSLTKVEQTASGASPCHSVTCLEPTPSESFHAPRRPLVHNPHTHACMDPPP